jgi:hypothetical protein
MVAMMNPNRLEKIQEVLGRSKTPLQAETRWAIAQRLEYYILTSKDEDELYSRLYNDFPTWALAFIDDDSGKPLFLSAWQIEFADKMLNHKYLWTFCSRKVGKSTVLSVIMAWLLCGADKHRMAGFAPTHGQDFVYDKARRMLKNNPFLFQTFIANENADKILAKNGSEYINRSISQNTGGVTARGEYGDFLYVDEIQDIDQKIMDNVVTPIIADDYSDKKMVLIGTTSLYTNPELENRWELHKKRASADSEYAWFTVDCWRGIKEGCINEKFIMDQKESMTPDDFSMEYEARFPATSSRFFSISTIQGCTRQGEFYPMPKPQYDYVMAVDWAKFHDNTQILVGQFDPRNTSLQYCHWTELSPKARVIDYEEQANLVKWVFHRYGCIWICPDATGNQTAIIERLLEDGEYNGEPAPSISPHFFYGYDPEKELDKQKLGYLGSTQRNEEMWKNHRQQMVRQRLRIPISGPKEQKFLYQYEKEHHELETKQTEMGIIRLVEQKGGYKDLAVCSAMLSLYLMQFEREPASVDVYGF